MIEILIAVVSGVLIGVLTGLIPGIHPNTVIFTFLPFYFVLQPEFALFMSFISGLGISHTLHDFIPAFFLKAPEAESALGSLPGIEMVNEGLGRKAFILTLIGGLFSTLIFIVLTPILFIGLEAFYPLMEKAMGYILVFFLIFIILESKSLVSATFITVLSGALGLLTLNSGFEQQFILMPIFSGLFAAPAISYSLLRKFEIPEQKQHFMISIERVKDSFAGFIAGFLAGIIPGIGAAVSTTFLTPLMNSDRESFVTGLGSVNTSDILISFLALYLIGRPRSGSSVALQTISEVHFTQVMFLIGCCVFAAGVSGAVSLKVMDLFLKFLEMIKFEYISLTALAILFSTVLLTTGLYGLLVFITSCSIGFMALITECRASSMAVLIVPSLLFFSGSFI